MVATETISADPKGVARAALDPLGRWSGPGEDVVLCWLLSLAPETDPADAARTLLREVAENDGQRVAVLLREVAAWPRARLAAIAARRRGG